MEGEKLHITAAPGVARVELVHLRASDLPPMRRTKIKRELVDLPSFVAYVKRWLDPSLATVFTSDSGMKAVFDAGERNADNQDVVDLDFKRPLVAKKWLDVLNGRSIPHKEFRDWLEKRWAEIYNGAELYARISTLSVSKTINRDAKFEGDHDYKIATSSEAGGDVVTLPKVFSVTIPLIEGHEVPYTIEVALKVTLPKSDDDPVRFALECDRLPDILSEASKDAALSVQGQLGEGWLFVNGSP